MSNSEIAYKLQDYARQLRRRHENLFRIKAYRRAADELMRLDRDVEKIVLENGRNALAQLPGIGSHIAETIAVFVETGEWRARH